MRRPTPLPAAPAAPEPDEGERARRVRAARRDRTPADDAGRTDAATLGAASTDATPALDETPAAPSLDAAEGAAAAADGLAPVRPLAPPVQAHGAAASAPDTALDAGPVQPEQEPVGVREVWRAARARRKALNAEMRRFTVRARRRRAIWIGALAALVVLVVGSLAAAYSPLFAVEKVTVIGAERIDPADLQAALGDQVGRPLALVDDSAVKAALVAFPFVESYTLEARPPHELVLRIVERTPVGVVSSPAGYTLVDAAGVALSTTASKPKGQALIDAAGGPGGPAFEAIGRVLRSLPDGIRAKVTAARASTADDVTLTLGGTRTTIMWGSAEDSAMKALVLATTMKSRPADTVRQYDVSSPEAVVVR